MWGPPKGTGSRGSRDGGQGRRQGAGFSSPTVLGNCVLVVGICHPAPGQTLRAESAPVSQGSAPGCDASGFS